MSFRDTSSFGKRMEYRIEGDMLNEGYDVYLPMVDDHGVDCVVKKDNGTFVEIQIKARSKNAKQPGCFTVDNHTNPIKNFYFIFYSELVKKMWIFSSDDFCKLSHLNRSGKNIGRRKITLVSPKGTISKKYDKFISLNFDFLK